MERFRPPHGDLFQKGDVSQLEEAIKEGNQRRTETPAHVAVREA